MESLMQMRRNVRIFIYMVLFRSDIITFHFIFGFALMSILHQMDLNESAVSCDSSAQHILSTDDDLLRFYCCDPILRNWKGRTVVAPHPHGQQCSMRATKMISLCDCILFHSFVVIILRTCKLETASRKPLES